MKYFIYTIIGAIILVAILTNPNQDRHKEVLRNKINPFMQRSLNEKFPKEKSNNNESFQALGLMLGGTLAESLIDNIVSTENYVLFSTTKVTWEGKTKVIGIGAFGNVFLLRDLDNEMK